MVRRIPTQVPQAMSRLLGAKIVPAPPPWYAAVIANPPPVLPPRQASARSRPGAKASDLPNNAGAASAAIAAHADPNTLHHQVKHLRPRKPRAAPIVYPADRVRRQFFADFPFEALRPVSLVESTEIAAENSVDGKNWTALSQRGAYPTVEDTIAFTVNLSEAHGMPLSEAYAQATEEFVQLRAAHELATQAAAAEARAYGATFKRDEWTRIFDKEQRALDEHARETSGGNHEALGHRWRKPKMWTTIVKPASIPTGEFTAGRAYAQRWQLPAPVKSAAPAAGDLVSAIGSGSATPADQDDVELMNAILGAPGSAPPTST